VLIDSGDKKVESEALKQAILWKDRA